MQFTLEMVKLLQCKVMKHLALHEEERNKKQESAKQMNYHEPLT